MDKTPPSGVAVPDGDGFLYNELLLHLWVTETFQPGRILAVACFALGFGALLGLLCSLLPAAAGKWAAVVPAAAVGVVWLMEYFITDAYGGFMTPGTVLNGAGGVATDYFDLVMSLLLRNLWRIALVLLPTVLYGLLCTCPKTPWKLRGLLAAGAAALYLLGRGAVNGLTRDAARLDENYEFDSAARCFGLNMALTLELRVNTVGREAEPAFQVPETVPEPPAEESQGTAEAPETVYDPHVFRFEDYSQPAWGASTIGGEFSNLVGLAPTNGGMCMKELRQQNMFLTMGKQLQRQGYSSTACHNHLKDFYDRDETHVHWATTSLWRCTEGWKGFRRCGRKAT